MDLVLRPLSPDLRGDFLRVLDGGECGACQCTAYYPSAPGKSGAERRAEMFSRGECDGFLLYADGAPAGWCQCAPLASGLRLSVPGAPEPGTWALTCLVLRPEHRRRGLSHAFLGEVLAALPQRGCRRVLVAAHRPGSYPDPASFLELPAALCERAGLRLVEADPDCPVYERRFP